MAPAPARQQRRAPRSVALDAHGAGLVHARHAKAEGSHVEEGDRNQLLQRLPCRLLHVRAAGGPGGRKQLGNELVELRDSLVAEGVGQVAQDERRLGAHALQRRSGEGARAGHPGLPRNLCNDL